MNNMTVRILFALFAIPTFMVAIYYNESRHWFMLGLVIIGLWEYARMIQTKFAFKEMQVVLPVVGAAIMACGYLKEAALAQPILLAVSIVGLLFYHFRKVPIENLFPTFILNAFALWFFSVWFFSSWTSLEEILNIHTWGPYLFLMICMWSSDTFAYFAGKFLGKKKLCPTISPKKTWAGAVGGAVGTMAFGFFYAQPFLNIDPVKGIFVGLLLSITAQLGDLFFSASKRFTGIKDSSNIFPGHGGVLDRFDSLFMAAPIFAGFLQLYLGV